MVKNTGRPIQLSLIIPLYNVSDRISSTLNDIANQSFKEFEVILVDDCSEDDSLDMALDFFTSCGIQVRFLRNQVNQGASFSRNRGMELASSSYMVFFDADDRMGKTFLEDLFLEGEKTSADLVFCGFAVKEELSGRKRSYLPHFSPKNKDIKNLCINEYLKGKRWLNASNIMYRSDLLRENEIFFTEGCRFAEDREVILKALYHSRKIGFVPEILSIYIQHPDQSTRKMKKDVSKYAHGVGVYLRLMRYFKDREEYVTSRKILRQIVNYELPNAYLKMVCSFAEMHDRVRFMKSLEAASIRKSLRSSWKCLYYKPEVSLKALMFYFFPEKLFRSYAKSDFP